MNNKDNIEHIFNSLTDEEKEAIKNRFKTRELTPSKITELREQLSITRERIREIEKRALRKLDNSRGRDDEGPDVA